MSSTEISIKEKPLCEDSFLNMFHPPARESKTALLNFNCIAILLKFLLNLKLCNIFPPKNKPLIKLRKKTPFVMSKNAQDKKSYNFADLQQIMKTLRDPQDGCPWDKQQDFQTIAPYTLEEAYEVYDAIQKNDMQGLKEELGDLLLQVVFHAQMADEKGYFSIDDVITAISQKMVSRHPHIFSDLKVKNAQEVKEIWEQQKDKEKQQKQEKIKGEEGSDQEIIGQTFKDVPSSFPALLRAQKLQKKAGKRGFIWKNKENIINKLNEEIQELLEEIKEGNLQKQQEELGDVLFVLANLARHLGINAEEALMGCNNKFINRFNGLEDDLNKKDKTVEACSLLELMDLWNAQKEKEVK